jgi:uncharacterized membrane protein
MANAILSPSAKPTPQAAEVRRIGLADIRIALRKGLDDFRAERGELLFLGVIYPVVGLLACLLTFRADLLPLAFPIAAGVSLMGPPLASGFYELARRRERGEDASWGRAFEVLKTPPFAAIAVLTAFVAALFGLWLLCAYGVYAATLGANPDTAANFWGSLFTTSDGWTMIVVGNLVGAAFALVVLIVSAVSFPMLVDRKAGPLTAAETSIRAVAKSPGTFALWGLTIAALLVLGSIPLFVGLAVVLPVLGYATWHLYTLAVVR